MTDEQSPFERVQYALEESHYGWNEVLVDDFDEEGIHFAKTVIEILIVATAGEIEYVQSTLDGDGASRVAKVVAFTPSRVIELIAHQSGPAPITIVRSRTSVKRIEIGSVQIDPRPHASGLRGVAFSVVIDGRDEPLLLDVQLKHLVGGAGQEAQQRLVKLLRTLLEDLDAR